MPNAQMPSGTGTGCNDVQAKDLLSLLGTSITPDKFRMYLGDGKEEYLRRHLSTCSEWQRLRAAGESTEEALTEQLCYASEKQDDAAPTPEQVGSAKDGKYHWPHRLWASLIKVGCRYWK